MSLITFVCANNRQRSVLAEFLARKHAGANNLTQYSFASAGVDAIPGQPIVEVSSYLFQCVHGIDANWIADFRSKELTQDVVDRSALLVALDEKVQSTVLQQFPGTDKKTILLASVEPVTPSDKRDIIITDMDERIPKLLPAFFNYLERNVPQQASERGSLKTVQTDLPASTPALEKDPNKPAR